MSRIELWILLAGSAAVTVYAASAGKPMAMTVFACLTGYALLALLFGWGKARA